MRVPVQWLRGTGKDTKKRNSYLLEDRPEKSRSREPAAVHVWMQLFRGSQGLQVNRPARATKRELAFFLVYLKSKQSHPHVSQQVASVKERGKKTK